jgi:hypothetical protein
MAELKKVRKPSESDGPPADATERERSILHGLACEWEGARRLLDPDYGRRLRRPLFALTDGRSRWGSWSTDRREICLSRHLVFNHTWDAVREVLFHEMAHQLADEVCGDGGETAHGQLFHAACAQLGANPRASGSFPLLTERLDRAAAAAAAPDRQLERIRKLLALAGSANRHEAEAAMLKAHELSARHNAGLVARAEPRELMSVFVGRLALRHSRVHYRLAALLSDFYFVLPIWVPAYVMDRSRMGRVLEISGTPRNIRTAAYVHAFMQRVIVEEWQNFAQGKAERRGRAADFGVGVIEGFRARLEAGRSHRPPTGSSAAALVPLKDPVLESYFKRRYPHTARVTRTAARVDRRTLNAGRDVGRRLVLSQPVAEIGAGGGMLPAISASRG